jgi:hypothetical protein
LNLCRIIYSFQERDVVVSKRFSSIWAGKIFPKWSPLIQAALRSYQGTDTPVDKSQLQTNIDSFLEFTMEYIDEYREVT